MRPTSDSANTKLVNTLAKKEASNAKLAIQNWKEPGRSVVKYKTRNWKTITNDHNAWKESNVKVKWEWLIQGYKWA